MFKGGDKLIKTVKALDQINVTQIMRDKRVIVTTEKDKHKILLPSTGSAIFGNVERDKEIQVVIEDD